MKVYIKLGLTNEDVLGVASFKTSDFNIEAEYNSSAIDLSKIPGFYISSSSDGITLSFSQDKYNAYLEEEEAKAELERQAKIKEESLNEIIKSLTVTITPSDRDGYSLKVVKIGDAVISQEYIESEAIEDDGSDYSKAILWEEGMEIEEGVWYKDEDNTIWKCAKL